MVGNPCSILNIQNNKMNFSKKIFSNLFLVFLVFLLSGVPADANVRTLGRSNPASKEHLFSGTGFFVKDRSPYPDKEAKAWFLEAEKFRKNNDFSKALEFYEKFSKRRSDAELETKTSSVMIGPEALYRAAVIREQRGDWQKAFEHLRLIAQAYINYDFERVAESLMRLAERLAKEDLPKKWGIFPRLRSGSADRLRLNQIVELARGPKFAPRALMALAEISLKDKKEEDAVDGLERLINLYPDNYLCEKAYFLLATIYESRVTGPSYDQGSTMKALNFYEDFLILFPSPPPISKHESKVDFLQRSADFKERRKAAEQGRKEMRENLAASKVEVGQYMQNYGKYFLIRWKELGNRPSLQFYNEAITVAPESQAARIAEEKVAQLRASDE